MLERTATPGFSPGGCAADGLVEWQCRVVGPGRPLPPLITFPISPLSMSFFKRPRDAGADDDDDDPIDTHLRLRSSRTAASVIAESFRSEQRAERRKTVRQKHFFFRKNAKEKRPQSPVDDTHSKAIPGKRRNVYVNQPLSAIEVDQHGEPIARYKRNKVRTTSERSLFFST